MSDQPEALRVADGGPAFPVVDPVTITSTVIPGMTLRDYFAAKAMAAYMSSQVRIGLERFDGSPTHVQVLAAGAYVMADAMLRARGFDVPDA